MSRHNELESLLQNEQREEQHSAYQSIVRFYANLSPEFLFRSIIYACKYHRYMTGHALPLSNDFLRRLSSIFQNMIDGSEFAINYLWTPAFTTMFLRDIVSYILSSSEQYEVTYLDIFLGRANSENGPGFSSNLGSNTVTDTHFFTGVAILFSLWSTSILGYTIYRRHWHSIPKNLVTRQTSPFKAAALLLHDLRLDGSLSVLRRKQLYLDLYDRIENASRNPFVTTTLLAQIANNLDPAELRFLKSENAELYASIRASALDTLVQASRNMSGTRSIRSILGLLFARYQRWVIGVADFHPAHILGFIGITWMLYAKIRFFEIMILKVVYAWQFDLDECDCHADSKAWEYMEISGQYECTDCGDWDFVPYRDVNNPQACIAALMNQPVSADGLNTGLKRFTHAAHIQSMDFSEMDWRSMTPQQLALVLSDLARVVDDELRQVTLSQPRYTTNIPTELIKQFSQFFVQFDIRSLALDRLGLSESQLNIIFSALKYPLESLSVYAMHMTDSEFIAIMNYSDVISSLHQLNLEYNRLSDNALQLLSKQFPKLLQYLNVAYNGFSENAYPYIVEILTNVNLEHLDLSGNVITDATAQALGSALQHSQIRNLTLQSMQLNDMQLISIMKQVNMALMRIDLTHNKISSLGISALMQSLANTSISELVLAENALGDDGFAALVKGLNSTHLNTLQLANTGISHVGLEAVVNTTLDQRVLRFNFTNNLLGDDGVVALAHWISVGSLNLSSLIINNVLAANYSMYTLLDALPLDIETLDISHNILEQVGVAALIRLLASTTRLSVLNIANTGINAEQAIAIVEALPGTGIKNLVMNNNPIGDDGAVAVAQLLIRGNLPHLNRLGDAHLPRDIEREYIKYAHPATQLEAIEMNDVGLSANGARALCRVNQLLDMLKQVEINNNFIQVESLSACAFKTLMLLNTSVLQPVLLAAGSASSQITPLNQSCEERRNYILLISFLASFILLAGAVVICLARPRNTPSGLFVDAGNNSSDASSLIYDDPDSDRELNV